MCDVHKFANSSHLLKDAALCGVCIQPSLLGCFLINMTIVWQESVSTTLRLLACARRRATALYSDYRFVFLVCQNIDRDTFGVKNVYNNRMKRQNSAFGSSSGSDHIRSVRWQSNLSWRFTQTSQTKSFGKNCNLHRTLKTSPERTK